MAHVVLKAKIEAAKEGIRDAEHNLRDVIANDAVVSRADMAEVSEAVHAASARLTAARATLDELEDTMKRSKLDAARAAISDAEAHLDTVLGELVVVPGADTQWVSKAVKDAFTKLKIANARLAELESNITDED